MPNKPMPYGLRLFLSLTALAFLIALVLCLFQYLISWIEAFLTMELPKTPLAISLYAIGILALSLLEYFLLLPPFYKGNVASMISLIEKERKVPCIKGILSVFLCCLISFLIGIPLGGEGPSVFIGALMGEGLFLWTKKRKDVFDGIAVGAATRFRTVAKTVFLNIKKYLKSGFVLKNFFVNNRIVVILLNSQKISTLKL